MSKDRLIPTFDMDTEKCKTCMLTKITKKPFQNVKHETKVLELIHNNLCDMHATPSLGNKNYFVTFIDDASSFFYVYLLHTKDEALDKFKVFKTKVELQQGFLFKRFRTDRGGEYMDTQDRAELRFLVRSNFGVLCESELKGAYFRAFWSINEEFEKVYCYDIKYDSLEAAIIKIEVKTYIWQDFALTPSKQLDTPYRLNRYAVMHDTDSSEFSPPSTILEQHKEEQTEEELTKEEITKTKTETMEQYMSKTRDNCGSGVARPRFEDNAQFDLKGQILKELHDNTFSGSDLEDVNEHIEKVMDIVDLFHVPNTTQDQIMLRVFHMSLTGAASRWLINEPSGSIKTWVELKTKFLNKYCPPARTTKKMEAINNFQQEAEETIFQAWERFKELLIKCPQHYLTDMMEVILSYNRLDIPTRQILDSKRAVL
ncbi:hypothetical protein Tco_0639416 [Tanacetum coccineum]